MTVDLENRATTEQPQPPNVNTVAEQLLETVLQAEDRSAVSDELGAAAHDPVSRFHFSRCRGHLMRPFRLDRTLRILEIGAGGGGLTRFLGETGARITALEPDQNNARLCAARCIDLNGVDLKRGGTGNVEVIHGGLQDLDAKKFDLVLMINGFDPRPFSADRASTPAALIDQARSYLEPDGALIFATENRFGLGAMLHPPSKDPAAYPTLTRFDLRDLLHRAGLSRQRWLFPFPDPYQVRTLLDQSSYLQENSSDFIDQLIRWPVPIGQRGVPVDDRSHHRVFLDAGLGPEVANAFLICATSEQGDPQRFLHSDVLAWCFSDERQRRFQGLKLIRHGDDGLHVEPRSLAQPDDSPRADWLHQDRGELAPFWVGRTLEQHLLDACQSHDEERIGRLLRIWDGFLKDHERRPATGDLDPPHPYLGEGSTAVLPARFLDLDFANFILTRDDELHYVDDEWRAGKSVDARLARCRALWQLARDLIGFNMANFWPAEITVNELAVVLGSKIDLQISTEDLERFQQAEASLIELVSGKNQAEASAHLRLIGRSNQQDFEHPPRALTSTEHVEITHLREELEKAYDAHEAARVRYENEIDKSKSVLHQTRVERDEHLQRSRQEIEARDLRLAEQSAELQRSYLAQQQAQSAYEQEIERLQGILMQQNELLEAGVEREASLIQSDQEARAELQRAYFSHREAQGIYEKEIRRLSQLYSKTNDQLNQLQTNHGRDLQHVITERQEAMARLRALRAEIERQWRSPFSWLRQFTSTFLRRHLRLIRRWLLG